MTKNVLKRNRNRLRQLFCETLESRQLMAADMVHHNFMMPEDSDMSGSVTPLDVLTVINRLNSQGASSQDEFNAAVDVDGDGALSPLDALNVINFVNRSAGENVLQVSQVSIQNRIERLEEAMDSELLPPNIDLVMATQIRDILRAGGFPEVGDRMVDGVLNRMLSDSSFLGQDSVQPTMNELPELPNDDNDFDYSQFPIISEVNDPTNDNGNGSFMDTQTAAPTLSFIEIELRKQLKVDNDAIIRVAVFSNPDEMTSGTWFYLTKEGIGISGNWSFETDKPETLKLFRSNVDIEMRIYVQYPGGGFVYYSWLPDGPVGYYFSPVRDLVEFDAYFAGVSGSSVNSIAGFTSYSGDLEVFDGIAPIEQQASDLFAIERALR